MSDLPTRIKKKLTEQKMSANALERKAGIRPSTLQNVLQGRTKSPNIELIQAVAIALKCTVSDLLGEPPSTPALLPQMGKWVPELYAEATQTVQEISSKQAISLTQDLFFQAVTQVYTYAVQYGKAAIDKDFADWVVKQKQESRP